MPRYSTEPIDGEAYKRQFDRYYSRFARLYDRLVKLLPFWGHLLSRALPSIEGPRVLEVSFGTGYLLTQMTRPEAQRWLAEGLRLLGPDGLLCLVSITPGTGTVSRFVSDTWTRVWRRRPMLVGGCRPIELTALLDGGAWQVVDHEVVTAWLVS